MMGEEGGATIISSLTAVKDMLLAANGVLIIGDIDHLYHFL